MKIDAKVHFVIDDDALKIHVDQVIDVPVDMDYTDPNEGSILTAIEHKLFDIYGVPLAFSYAGSPEDGDFVVDNMSDLLVELAPKT